MNTSIPNPGGKTVLIPSFPKRKLRAIQVFSQNTVYHLNELLGNGDGETSGSGVRTSLETFLH